MRTIFTGGLSLEGDAELGREEHPKVPAEHGGAYADPVLNRHVTSNGNFLAQTSERPDLTFTFTILDTPIVNAFALPGGYVYITRGLLALAENEAEVAGVLGHEIGHVESRDVTRNALRSAGSAGLLSLVLGEFAGGGAAVLIAEWTLNASYTREAEAAADVFALEMLDASGTDAGGMADFFDKIAALQGNDSGPSMPAFLATHPDSHARAHAARNFAAAQGYGTTPIPSAREWEALRNIRDD